MHDKSITIRGLTWTRPGPTFPNPWRNCHRQSGTRRHWNSTRM